MENKIAVIIPAYKDTYLLNTLISINNQTDKKFNLYICNDSSPYNIEKVLADFKKINKIHFEYIKFENNLGGSDLIQHWNRCINQIKNEEWIWLFSDDDLMEDNCIRDLNHQINLGIKEDVIHFNINIIDNQDKLIRKTNAYPDHLSSADFFKKLYSWKIEARMPEFVLRRSTFEEKKGFVNFDLAWRSDNATIIKLAHPNGIKSIDTSRINWRYSNENISGINNLSMIRRKQDSTIKFFNWMDSFLKATKQKYPFGRIYRNIIFSKFLYIRQLNNPLYENSDIIFLKYISDKDLVSVYNGATATFFPTRYEGFGFPILESFACNTPVVTCRNTSLPEVGGNIALYTDEDGVDEMSYYMELFENENFDLHLFREQAKNYIKRFSWENTALQYVELYKSLL